MHDTNPHEADLLQATGEIAARLAEILRLSGDADRMLAAFDGLADTLEAYGENPADIAEIRATLEADPHGTLLALGAGAAKHGGQGIQVDGDDLLIFDNQAGKCVGRYHGALKDEPPEARAFPTPEAIDALKREPWLAGDFDAKYGRGAAAYVMEEV